MTESAVVALLTEDGIKSALIEARGDIFVASQMLGVTAVRVDRAIKVSGALQAAITAIQEIPNDALEKRSTEAVNRAVESRISLYRVAGLDSLYELATMPIDVNSAQNQVRLAAAARLAGPTETIGAGGDIADALRSLNDDYHKSAPRIRLVRERISIEVNGDPRDITPPPQSDQE